MDYIAEFFGKLHPIVLHFPLVLLVVGATAEGVRLFRDSPFLARAVTWLFALGAITALLSATSGWLLAAHEHIRSDQRTTLEWHRWLGLATTVVAGLAWLSSFQANKGAWARPRRIIALSAGLLVIATGHFGGEMVWGRDWFQPSEELSHE